MRAASSLLPLGCEIVTGNPHAYLMCAANEPARGSNSGVERCNAGRVRVGIELERVLARLEESDGAENVVMDEGVAHEALGALAVVDSKRVGCRVECLSGVAAS